MPYNYAHKMKSDTIIRMTTSISSEALKYVVYKITGREETMGYLLL